MAETGMADTLLEGDGSETCYGLSQVLFGLYLSIKPGEAIRAGVGGEEGRTRDGEGT